MAQKIGVGDLIYSFGTKHPGLVTLHNFPKFLQNFHRPDGDLLDLAATDILRSRELGVPRYNEFRRLLHLAPARDFDDLTSNKEWARQIEQIYGGDIEQVDLTVGAFAERRPDGFAFSDTAFRIFILMASRRLNSDRFFTTHYTRRSTRRPGWTGSATTPWRRCCCGTTRSCGRPSATLPNAFQPWARAVPGAPGPPPGSPKAAPGSPRLTRPPWSARPLARSGRCSGRAALGPSPTAAAGGLCCWAPADCGPGLAAMVSYALLWRGKVVNARQGRLKNLISAFSVQAIAAAVYQQDSWYDGKPCIVLDYSKTSFVARMIRDEIREIAPGVYLGLVFLGRRHVLDFALDFTRAD